MNIFTGLKKYKQDDFVNCRKCKRRNLETVFLANSNLVNLVAIYIQSAKDEDLYSLRNNNVCYVFNKQVLDFGADNFIDFILNSKFLLLNLLEFKILPKDSVLYSEHINRAENNEFLWKYTNRGHNIVHTYLSKDSGKVFVNYSVLNFEYKNNDMSNAKFHYNLNNIKRLYIEGKTLRQYIENKSDKEKLSVIIKCIEYALDKFDVGNNRLNPALYDFHWENIIIDKDENIHFIDNEMIANEPINKNFAIKYFADHIGDLHLKQKVLEHYNISSASAVLGQQKANSSKYFINDILPEIWLDEFKY